MPCDYGFIAIFDEQRLILSCTNIEKDNHKKLCLANNYQGSEKEQFCTINSIVQLQHSIAFLLLLLL